MGQSPISQTLEQQERDFKNVTPYCAFLRRTCTMEPRNWESQHMPERNSYTTHSDKLKAVEIVLGKELVSEVQFTRTM